MNVEPLRREVWADLAGRVPDRFLSPFQLPPWMDFQLRTLPRAEDCSLSFRFSDGAVAAVPIVKTRHRLGHASYASLAEDQYGGPLSDRALTDDELKSVYGYLARHVTPIRVTLTPTLSEAGEPPVDERWKMDPATCHLLALPQTYEEWFTKTASESCRRAIRRATRSKLTVSRTKATADLEAYYHLYQSSAARWGKKAAELHPRTYFGSLLACPLSCLYVVYKDSAPAAGMITLESSNCTIYYLGATDLSFSLLRPADFGLSEVIRDSIANRRAILNLGASLGMPALEQFKEKFGAVKRPYATYFTQDFWSSSYRSYAYYRSVLRRRLDGVAQALRDRTRPDIPSGTADSPAATPGSAPGVGGDEER